MRSNLEDDEKLPRKSVRMGENISRENNDHPHSHILFSNSSLRFIYLQTHHLDFSLLFSFFRQTTNLPSQEFSIHFAKSQAAEVLELLRNEWKFIHRTDLGGINVSCPQNWSSARATTNEGGLIVQARLLLNQIRAP